MKRFGALITRISIIVILLLALILGGCAPSQTSETTNRQFDENWRFVPRVHVEDNSFGVSGGDYRGCSYDTLYEGYWCPR